MSIVTQNQRLTRAEERAKYNEEVFKKIGRKPFGTRVLVEIPDDSEKDADGNIRKGSIILAKETIEKEQRDSTVCKIVAIGADAWFDTYDPPKVGDWMVLKRYAGIDIVGDDGKRYRAPLDIDLYVTTSGNSDVNYLG